ncbi:NADP-dependent oxidoreductase [Streptomyces misionensis]|uniref:NADP-dependent oxidoreductase n=1 Tax=Streptomyces misionensis TaxID=67331 RepID=A0A5C6IM00_9ACTN|nr:NADP-dependent oxidoreductase [Streptomyces misionensis]TWV29533.1 NADP-dependent oxidoreductase [Streptomyces misionensis]
MQGGYRAVVFSEYGGPEVLQVVERPLPAPGAGEVRLAVHAAGVNPLDWKVRSGAAASFLPVEFPVVPGGDVAGVVDAVGPGVTEFAVGDEVLGSIGFGGYAEAVVVSAGALTEKPASLMWETAAALPVAANTALHALDELKLRESETIVIDGAAGGVGTVAVQLAALRGARVIGTAREANHAYLRSLGATPVAYGAGLADRIRSVAPQGVDAVLDASGRGSLSALIEVAGGADRVVTIADFSAARVGVRMISADAEGAGQRIGAAAALAAEGRLTVPIAATYSLEEAAEAHRVSEQGHVRGKLVILPRGKAG